MNKKFWLAVLAGLIVHNFLGWFIYDVAMEDLVNTMFHGFTREKIIEWVYVPRSIIIVFFMALLYNKWYGGGTPWLEGAKFGAIIGLMAGGSSAFEFYSMLPLPGFETFLIYIPEFLSYCVVGLTIGTMIGDTSVKAGTQ